MLEEFTGHLNSLAVQVGALVAHVHSTDPVELTGQGCVEVRTGTAACTVFVEAPLGDSVGYWEPDAHWERTLVPDWYGKVFTSLVRSAPMGVLYTHTGDSQLGYALDVLIDEASVRYGVSEEQGSFIIRVDFARADGRPTKLRLTTGGPLDRTVPMLSEWLTEGIEREPIVTPPSAEDPVYSTWYSFHHDMNEELVLREAGLAARLGLGSFFIDYGWQRGGNGRCFEGCGDWVPDTARFPDLPGLIGRLDGLGLASVLWIGPLLLGEQTAAYDSWKRFAPFHDRILDTHILDPRHPEVRDHVVATCLRVLDETGASGLKIDFLETAMSYKGTPGNGDIEDVGVAMRVLLDQLADALSARPLAPLIEFRQPYVNPAVTPYGNILRVSDCPADPVRNRTSIADCRMVTPRTVHSDPIMWAPGLDAQAVVRHLHCSLFAVPQVSVVLARLPEQQLSALRSWLTLWRELRSTTLHGTFQAEASYAHFPILRAVDPDGLRSVTAVHLAGLVVRLPGAVTDVVVNATPEPVLHLDLTGLVGPIEITAYDLMGIPVTTHRLGAGGISAVPTPASGWLTASRQADVGPAGAPAEDQAHVV